MARVLVVDDDAHLREVVRYALERAGHRVDEAGDGAAGWRSYQQQEPDLVVLDVVMPEIDGLELCRRIRAEGATPVIFLSTRGEELDRVLGLELGGDDYMVKPFSTRELVSRVKAVLRRARSEPEEAPTPRVTSGDVCIDLESWRCTVQGDPVSLTVTELRLLSVMLRRTGKVWTRDALIEQGYPGVHHVSPRTLDSHVRNIRNKLGDAGERLETVHGLGYRWRRG